VYANDNSSRTDSRELASTSAPAASPSNAVGQARSTTIAAVIPSFRVTRHVCDVIKRIGPDCQRIYVVDDCCPDNSGKYVETNCADPRVNVIRHARNLGVGGAVMTGIRAAIADGAAVIVKIDGDGQMPPELLSRFVRPILDGRADYTKGNRFYDLTNIRRMPTTRIIGNAILSLMAKLSTGYWDIFDPTNGYVAINSRVASKLPLDKISPRYFFETDMLFRLNTIRAVVVDIPMDAVYGDEVSNLRISRIVGEFLGKHIRNFHKRIFYNYFLRDVSIASIELLLGSTLLIGGLAFGIFHWIGSASAGMATPVGTVMLSAVSVLVGLQLVLSFLNYDIASVPRRPIHDFLPEPDVKIVPGGMNTQVHNP
jgi:dolichol-phosphate mannosyltransferase